MKSFWFGGVRECLMDMGNLRTMCVAGEVVKCLEAVVQGHEGAVLMLLDDPHLAQAG